MTKVSLHAVPGKRSGLRIGMENIRCPARFCLAQAIDHVARDRGLAVNEDRLFWNLVFQFHRIGRISDVVLSPAPFQIGAATPNHGADGEVTYRIE